MNALPLQIACLALGQLAQPSLGTPPSPSFSAPAAPTPAVEFAPQRQRFSTADPQPSFNFRAAPAERISDPNTFDPNARQATAAIPVRSADTSVAAEDLARICTVRLSDLPEQLRRNGKSVTLLQLLLPTQRSAAPSQIVRRYWELAIATGDYRFAIQEEDFLSQLSRPVGQYESSLLAAELSASRATRQQARLLVLERQQELNASLAQISLDSLPWPADPPLVGRYRTRFETLFAGQMTPLRLRQIDQALPLLQEQIELRSEAIMAADSALNVLRRGTLDVERLIAAHRRLRHQRREFLKAVHAYNQQIAEYALAVTGPNAAARTLVATLINTPRANLVPVERSAVRQTGAFQPR